MAQAKQASLICHVCARHLCRGFVCDACRMVCCHQHIERHAWDHADTDSRWCFELCRRCREARAEFAAPNATDVRESEGRLHAIDGTRASSARFGARDGGPCVASSGVAPPPLKNRYYLEKLRARVAGRCGSGPL